MLQCLQHARCLRWLIQPAQVLNQHGNLQSRLNDLYRLAIDLFKPGPQALMPGHNPLQGTAQGRALNSALEIHTQADVVRLADTLHLGQKPQSFLGKR